MSSCLPIHTVSPETTTGGHTHGEEAEHEIDGNDASDLIQFLGGFGECLPFDGRAKTAQGAKNRCRNSNIITMPVPCMMWICSPAPAKPPTYRKSML